MISQTEKKGEYTKEQRKRSHCFHCLPHFISHFRPFFRRGAISLPLFLSVFYYFLKCRKWHIDFYWSQTELCSKTLVMCPYWVIRLNSCTVQSWQLLNDHQFDTRFSLLFYYPCICIILWLVNSYMFLCVCVFPPHLLIPFDKISYRIHTICFMWPCEWLIGHICRQII